MISGTVTASHEIVILVRVRGTGSAEQDIDAVLDTGFNGSLTLPTNTVASLGLQWQSRGSATLANGQVVQFDVYCGAVIWDGAMQRILVQAVDGAPLLGMALLMNHDLRARLVVAGRAEITAIP